MNPDTAQVLVTLLGAGGGGAALLALVNGLVKWLSGATHREQVKNSNLARQRTQAIKERDEAEQERDDADRKRRIANEYASKLRRQLFENGITPIEWPSERPLTLDREDENSSR